MVFFIKKMALHFLLNMIYYVRSRQIGSENMYRDPVGHRIKTLNNLMKRAMDKEFVIDLIVQH